MDGMQSRINKIKSLANTPVLAPDWPVESEPLTLEHALAAAGKPGRADAFRKSLQAAQALENLLQSPIVAVLGGLNAGKSSVVGGFLSNSGRGRIPIGEEDSRGTHRFVYWVPESWLKEETLSEAFFKLLEAAHGPGREYLSEDPAEAERQYGSGRDDMDVMRIPLIATDARLDTLSAAFLDCPDIHTRDRDAPGGASRLENQRLDFLLDAARVCSAFLVVWLRQLIRDRLLERLLDLLRGRSVKAPLYLLLNQIHPEDGQPERTRNDPVTVRMLEDYGIGEKACYGAFHFKIPGWKDFTPPLLVKNHDSAGAEVEVRDSIRPVPGFFEISTNDAGNNPDLISEERFLANLPSRLDMAELQRQKMGDSWKELSERLGQDLECIEFWAETQRNRAREIHRELLEFCKRKFTDSRTGEPLQLATREFSTAMQESFLRTAPVPVRWALRLAGPFDRSVKSARTALRRLDFRRGAVEVQKGVKRGFKNKQGIEGLSIFNPQQLSEEMKALRFVPAAVEVEHMEQAWEAVGNAFFLHPLEINATDLDRMNKGLWEHTPIRGKLRVAGNSILKIFGSITALAGVLTAAIDGGATILATYSLTQTVASAVPGMAALAGGAAGAAVAWAGFAAGAMKWNTLPYLSRLFALSCDAFDVPRDVDQGPVLVEFGKDQSPSILPEPNIPRIKAVCNMEDIRLWRKTEGFQELESVLSGN